MKVTSETGIRAKIGTANENLAFLVRNARSLPLTEGQIDRLVDLAGKPTWSLTTDCRWLHDLRSQLDSDYARQNEAQSAAARAKAHNTDIDLKAAYLLIRLNETEERLNELCR